MDDDFQMEQPADAEPEFVEEPVVVEEPAPVPTMPRRASSDAHMPTPTPSEATNKWKSENEKRIKQRDAEAAKAKQDLMKKAEQALEKIKSEHAQLIAKNSKANREAQAKAQAAAAAKPAAGGAVDWKKLAQLVDLDKETTGKERMRLLFKAKVAEAK